MNRCKPSNTQGIHVVFPLLAAACLFLMAAEARASTYTLGTSNLLEGPLGGTDTVYVAVSPAGAAWSASTNVPWLHLSTNNQSGYGSTNVVFTLDFNPYPTRTGTITIGDQTLTVVQTGPGYTYAGLSTFPATSLPVPVATAMAADAAGNVYFGTSSSDGETPEIVRWTPTNNASEVIVSSGVTNVEAMAVAPSGNIYFIDPPLIREWQASSGQLITLATDNSSIVSIAIDASEDVYFPDTERLIASSIKEWVASSNTVVTVLASNAVNRLRLPRCVAVDAYTNVYICENSQSTLKIWNPCTQTFVSVNNKSSTLWVAADPNNNVYFAVADSLVPQGADIVKWSPITGAKSTLLGSSNSLDDPLQFALDGAGNVYVSDISGLHLLSDAFVNTTPRYESYTGGSDALPPVVPATIPLINEMAPSSDQSWLAITGVTNDVVSFSWLTNSGPALAGHITVLGDSIPVIEAGTGGILNLGYSSRVEGPTAGADTVLVSTTPVGCSWTASADVPWIHLAVTNGYLPGVISFTFDANPGPTRQGTLSLNGVDAQGATLIITQAGSTYVQVQGPTILGGSGSFNSFWSVYGQGVPIDIYSQRGGLAVDPAGNLYIADGPSGDIYEWTVTNNQFSVVLTNFSNPEAVALDPAGNLYVADYGSNAIFKCSPASGTRTNLTGVASPNSVALDSAGNVYFTQDGQAVAAEEWIATNGQVVPIFNSTVVTIAGTGVAVDAAGDTYVSGYAIANVPNLYQLNPPYSAPVPDGPGFFDNLAADGGGNLYGGYRFNGDEFGQYGGVGKWSRLTQQLNWVTSGYEFTAAVQGVAVDASGNIYFSYSEPSGAQAGNISELPYAFVDPTPRTEGGAPGTDTLPGVIPATQNLLPPFAPVSDQPWLTITGVTNGLVSFAFTGTTTNRVGHITLLNESIPIIQDGPVFSLASTNFVEGPGAGSDGDLLAVAPANSPWTASANAGWLHVSAATQSGLTSTNVVFSFDANTGPARTATLTIAGQTVTVTQAGAGYIPAGVVPVVTSAGMFGRAYPGIPLGPMAVDSSGNLYFTKTNGDTFERSFTTGNLLNLTALGAAPLAGIGSDSCVGGLAIDAAGDLYMATLNLNMFPFSDIAVWNPQTDSTQPAAFWWMASPSSVSVDQSGNLYFTDPYDNMVKEWVAASGTAITAPGNFNAPTGIALDALNNVEIADRSNNAVELWSPAANTVGTLVSSNALTPLSEPTGVAADVSGDIYIADAGDGAVKKWSAASNTLSTVAGSGLTSPANVALDPMRNLYIYDTGTGTIQEQPRAFVDPTPHSETAAAGSDALDPIIPATESLAPPLGPTSDQPWLVINSNYAGVVSFSFAENTTGATRTAHIILLGQQIAVTQGVIGTSPVLTNVVISNGTSFSFSFTNNPGASFTVLSSTNLTLPQSSWTVLGAASNLGGGQFQFSGPATNGQLYYMVRSP